MSMFLFSVFLLVFKHEFYLVAQANLKFKNILPLPHNYWDYGVPLGLVVYLLIGIFNLF